MIDSDDSVEYETFINGQSQKRRSQSCTEKKMSNLVKEINCGDGAFMSICDPPSFEDGGLEWRLRYGNVESVRYIAAGIIESYDYLISDQITTREAIRRLRLLRNARSHNTNKAMRV